MRIAVLMLAIMQLMHVRAAEIVPAAEPGITVCIDEGFRLFEMGLARALTSTIYSKIGTEIKWGCPGDPEQAMVVTIRADPRDVRHPGALGYAQPFTGHIRVFYDRLGRFSPELRVNLLAHVLAHEIAHVLEGTDRHSQNGIMKAHWDSFDFGKMMTHHLEFTAEDVVLIRRGIAARHLARPMFASLR